MGKGRGEEEIMEGEKHKKREGESNGAPDQAQILSFRKRNIVIWMHPVYIVECIYNLSRTHSQIQGFGTETLRVEVAYIHL